MLKYVFLSFFLLYGVSIPQSGIVINEFMASNKTSYEDPKYLKYSDWVELYNAGTAQINLNGYFFTDDLSEPAKWKFTRNVLLNPGQFYIIFADGEDTLNHTSFNLSREGEQLGLFYPDGTPADTFTFYYQKTDVSFGRYPDGGSEWYYMYNPSPGKVNDTLLSREILSKPEFSIKSGFYSGAQLLTLTSTDPEITIRYTTDGSVPEETSPQYTSPLNISKTTVVRAVSYKEGSFPSGAVTNTYLIDENISLPVVSVSTDPENLWDDKTGIYVAGTNGITGYCSSTPKNYNQDWERAIHLELFEKDKKLAFEVDAGMKIGGQCTRKYDQKPLALFLRSVYGDSKINYKVFPDKQIEEYNNLNLRNSGQDWYRTLVRDGLIQNIVKHQLDVEWQAYKPAVLFLNGEYWGIHDLREKHNEHYLASNYNLNPDSIDIVAGYVSGGTAEAKAGSAQHFVNMIKYMQTHDMSNNQNYDYITTQMDVDQYIDYLITELFFANADWPGGNIKFWRPQRPDGKWRWIIFDMDMAFGAHANSQFNTNSLYLATSVNNDYYANPKESTYQLRTLLNNERFRNIFIQRFAYHLNTTFGEERIKFFIDSIKSDIAAEIPRHTQRWLKSCSYDLGTWEKNFQILYTFTEKRHNYVRDNIITKFGLSGNVQFTVINNTEGGKVLLDNIELKADTLSGLFFKDIPIQMIAKPEPGYVFRGWKGLSSSSSDTISIVLNNAAILSAEFEKSETAVQEERSGFEFQLGQNYPNPFNPATRIKFQIPQSGRTTLKLYDLLGKEIALLLDETLEEGSHSIDFNGSALSSGIYFYQLNTAGHSSTRKMILLK